MGRGRERRGFKGKLVTPFYGAPEPAPVQYSSKVQPSPASTAPVGYVVDEFPAPPPPPPLPKEKLQIPRVDAGRELAGYGDGEENVDKMAAKYISRIHERLRLERDD